MECPAYKHERWKLRPKKGKPELKYEDLMSNKEKTAELAHYILDTRRFAQVEPERQHKERSGTAQEKNAENSPRWDRK